MDDLISRQSVIDAVTKYCTQYDLRELLADIEVMPSAQKTGYWRKRNISINCSVCKQCSWSLPFEDIVTRFNYCPHCGAYMRGEQDE